jgi:hypothetical protein
MQVDDAGYAADTTGDGGAERSDGDASVPILFRQANTGNFPDAAVANLDFLSDIAPHSAIVVALDYIGAATAVTVEDSQGNAYALLPRQPLTSDGVTGAIAVAADAKGGQNAVQVTLNARASWAFEVYIHEYSGVALTNAIDVTSTGTGSGGVLTSLTTQETSVPHELVFGFVQTFGQAAPGEGFTARTTFNNNLTEDMEVYRTGVYQATARDLRDGGANSWSAIMTTLRGQ